jgi:hypothetical protein
MPIKAGIPAQYLVTGIDQNQSVFDLRQCLSVALSIVQPVSVQGRGGKGDANRFARGMRSGLQAATINRPTTEMVQGRGDQSRTKARTKHAKGNIRIDLVD